MRQTIRATIRQRCLVELLPAAAFAVLTTLGLPGLHAQTEFVRGDVDESRETDISDATVILNFLFRSGPQPSCMDAADANDDGSLNISDGVAILVYLFLGGPALPPPTESCGVDLTRDDLGCDRYRPCTECFGDCEDIGCWVQNSDDTLICVQDLPSCEEVAAVYSYVTTELGPRCDDDSGCRLVWGTCQVGLGVCYYAVSANLPQHWLDVLFQRWTELGCLGPVCDCPAPPDTVSCVDGDCQFDF